MKPIPEPRQKESVRWRCSNFALSLSLTDGHKEIDDIELTAFARDRDDKSKAMHLRQGSVVGVVHPILLSESIEQQQSSPDEHEEMKTYR